MSKDLHLPDTGFVRLPVVLNHIPVSKSTWWDGVKSGRFPKPIKLGNKLTRAVAWRAEDIHRLIKQLTEQSPKQSHLCKNGGVHASHT